jgi:hypothetical protein
MVLMSVRSVLEKSVEILIFKGKLFVDQDMALVLELAILEEELLEAVKHELKLKGMIPKSI